MNVPFYERLVIFVSIAILVIAFAAVVASTVIAGIHLPSPVLRIDPRELNNTPPFDQPGLREVGPNSYEAVMIAQTWAFTPNELQVPVGSKVTFRVASKDVTHGFLISKVGVNLTLIPGQVAEATATFREPGTYLIVCHEYCGIGHQAMFGKVIVQ